MTTTADIFSRLAAKAPALAHTSAATRCLKIKKLLDATLKARPAIIKAGQTELGLAATDIDAQLLMVKGECEFFIKNLKSWMQDKPVKGSLMTLGKKSYIRYEPKGIVLNLATWNAPICIGLVPAIGAIAAGNAFILKPSELAPHSAQVLADIVKASMSEDEFAVIQGGPETAQELLALPFNHIFYIGGHAVGRIVMRAAAQHFATITLEMGGKNPTIIDASADIEAAALKIAWGRLANAGQVCVAPDYAMVHISVRDAFIEAIKMAINKIYNPHGAGIDKSPEYPRIINDNHFKRVKSLIDDARAKGGNVVVGGQSDPASRYIAPTIITNISDDMRIMQEEIFGPVLAVVPFKDKAEVIAQVRSRPKPLALYVFAKDRAAIDYYLANTSSGSSVVNHNLIQSGTNPYLPFGGVNASGMGRLGGWSTFAECSNARSIVEEGPPLDKDPMAFFPPYTDKYKKMTADLLRKKIIMPDMVISAINGMIKAGSAFNKK